MKNPDSREANGVLIGFNRSGEREKLNLPKSPRIDKYRQIQKDARVLQFLKHECTRTRSGSATLQQVFTGLLSVHNRHLVSFADALAREAN